MFYIPFFSALGTQRECCSQWNMGIGLGVGCLLKLKTKTFQLKQFDLKFKFLKMGGSPSVHFILKPSTMTILQMLSVEGAKAHFCCK